MDTKRNPSTPTILGAVFLVTFLLYHLILSNFFPVDENNYLKAPDWYLPVGLSCSAVITAFSFIVIRFVYRIFGKRLYLNKSFCELSAQQTLLQIDNMEGHQFEYWCADLLTQLGFHDVVVTQGSGDQGVDVLASREGLKYAIQCKCYTSNLGNTPIQEIYTGKTIYGCHVGAVMTNVRFTAGGQQAAQATGVLLWDRDWIMDALTKLNPVSSGLHNSNRDQLFFEVGDFVVRWCVTNEKAISYIFKVDRIRSILIIDDLEKLGVVGPYQGSIARNVLVTKSQWEHIKNQLRFYQDQ